LNEFENFVVLGFDQRYNMAKEVMKIRTFLLSRLLFVEREEDAYTSSI